MTREYPTRSPEYPITPWYTFSTPEYPLEYPVPLKYSPSNRESGHAPPSVLAHTSLR